MNVITPSPSIDVVPKPTFQFTWFICIASITIALLTYYACLSIINERRESPHDHMLSTNELDQPNEESNFWSDKLMHDLRRICLSYGGIFIDSHILTGDEHCELYSLLVNTTTNILNLSLLYRYTAADQTFDEQIFYKCCDKRKNIVFLLKNNWGNVIGGFTSVGIIKDEQTGLRQWLDSALAITHYIFDPNIFVFRIRSCSNLPPKLYTLQRDYDAIYRRDFIRSRESISQTEAIISFTNFLSIFGHNSSLMGQMVDMAQIAAQRAYVANASEAPFDTNIKDFVGECCDSLRIMEDFDVDVLEIFEIKIDSI